MRKSPFGFYYVELIIINTKLQCLILIITQKKSYYTYLMWRIRVSKHSVLLFRQLVKPYLLPVFDYKLGNQ